MGLSRVESSDHFITFPTHASFYVSHSFVGFVGPTPAYGTLVEHLVVSKIEFANSKKYSGYPRKLSSIDRLIEVLVLCRPRAVAQKTPCFARVQLLWKGVGLVFY